MLNNRTYLIFSLFLVSLISITGLILRLPPAASFQTITGNTLTPYYFDKFQRLVTNGKFPQEDIWEFAPQSHPENTPPGLAYISKWLWGIWKLAAPDAAVIEFAEIFPLLAFSIWVVMSWLIFFAGERWKINQFLVFSAAIAFAPVAISLTSYGNYTQETVGVFLLFISTYFLVKEGVNRRDLILGVASITALILFWQQFPILYFGGVLLILLQLFLKNLAEIKRLSFILGVPLLLSEAVIRLYVRNDYSPISMIWEFILGYWLGFKRNPDFLLAMARGNWRSVNLPEFYDLFGPLFILLLTVGFLFSIKKCKRVNFGGALVFGILGLVLILMFEKEKNLAFGLFLLPVALATESIFKGEGAITLDKIRGLPHSVSTFLKGHRRKLGFGLAMLLLLTGWFFFAKTPGGIAMVTSKNPPRPEVSVNVERNDDRTIDVIFRLQNRGGTTFYSDKLWVGLTSGMHIEVGNAEILQFSASSPTSEYTWQHYAVYPFARWGDFYFTEIKFKQLRKNEYGEIYLKIKPLNGQPGKPVIYYRGWMPETSCILELERSTPENLTIPEAFGPGNYGESCIIRWPANESEKTICPIRVSATRDELQNFRCDVTEL